MTDGEAAPTLGLGQGGDRKVEQSASRDADLCFLAFVWRARSKWLGPSSS